MKRPGKSTRYGHEELEIVKFYSSLRDLLKPEKVVLEGMKDQLPTMRMLDIGIGGGRTTYHFARLAKEYVGIDFDDNMIHACRSIFPNPPETMSLIVGDARAMEMFADGYFDFILFSFNGIDYLSYDDRIRALREIKRVGRKGGYFLFSTHNLNSIDWQFDFKSKLSWNGAKLIGGLRRYLYLILLNESPKQLKKRQYAIINDGHGWYHQRLTWALRSLWKRRGHNVYIKPEAQIKQLEDLHFGVFQIYTSEGQIIDKRELAASNDPWLYYLCGL